MDSYVSPLTARELLNLQDLVHDFPKKVVDRLCMLDTLSNLTDKEKLAVIGILTDHGGDMGDRRALTKATKLGTSLDQDSMDSVDRSMLNYRIGTAFSNRAGATRPEKNGHGSTKTLKMLYAISAVLSVKMGWMNCH